MSTKARYTIAADALAEWRDSLFNGTAPTLYPVGGGALASVEIGPGRVIILGGIPGGGKTGIAMQWVIDGLRAVPTLRAVVCNVEMTPAVLLDRQLSRLAGVPLDFIAKRTLNGEHAGRIDCGLATLEAVADRLAFVNAPYDLGNVAATADVFGGELLVLDYLQRIRPPGEHADNRYRVDALMDFIRQFADAGCAVLCVSAVARTKDNKGRSSYDGSGLSLASFRESSELEFGADSAYVLVPDRKRPELVTLRCLKHRHGEPRDVLLLFNRRLQAFTPIEPAPEAADLEPDGKLTTALQALWASTPAAADGADE